MCLESGSSFQSFTDQTTKWDITIHLFLLLSIPRNFSVPFYFHFTHFPQKWINARKNASTPRTGGSLFSGIVEFRVLNLGRPRALCDLSFCFSMLSFSLVPHVSQSSLSYLPPPAVTRPPVRFAHCKTAFFPFRMVFTEDLGNCSLTVRTTSASNAGPPDGFVR